MSLALYVEMFRGEYMAGTASVSIHYNGLTEPDSGYLNQWPMSAAVRSWLEAQVTDESTIAWVWQFVSMSAFCVFNVIGLPLLAASILFAFVRSFRD